MEIEIQSNTNQDSDLDINCFGVKIKKSLHSPINIVSQSHIEKEVVEKK